MATRLPPAADEAPLDESGELRLSPELRQLADQLRGEAARLAERTVPQASAGKLLGIIAQRQWGQASGSRAAEGGSSWRKRWLPVSVASCAMLGLIGLVLLVGNGNLGTSADSAGEPARKGEAESATARPDLSSSTIGNRSTLPSRNGSADRTGRAEPSDVHPAVSSQAFLSADPTPPPDWSREEDAWVGQPQALATEPLTADQHVALLERALERYRGVIAFQQERIRQDQIELEAARVEIERLERLLGDVPAGSVTGTERWDELDGP
jgi:hypothetical protein